MSFLEAKPANLSLRNDTTLLRNGLHGPIVSLSSSTIPCTHTNSGVLILGMIAAKLGFVVGVDLFQSSDLHRLELGSMYVCTSVCT